MDDFLNVDSISKRTAIWFEAAQFPAISQQCFVWHFLGLLGVQICVCVCVDV